MLNALHLALDRLLRADGHIEPLDADVSFERPADEWVSSLIRPTVDFFLFDIRENTERRETNLQLHFKDGRAVKRLPPRRIDLWYMVSVLTTEVADEHELLWRVLGTLLKHEQWPNGLLPDDLLPQDQGISGRLASADESRSSLFDVWSAIGARPRPALCYVLTAPLDLVRTFESPLVLTRTARLHRLAAGASAPRVATHIGGVVRDGSGRPLTSVLVSPVGSARASRTDGDGRYRLYGLAEGPRRLRVEIEGLEPREVEVTVPSESYDIVVDG